MTAPSDEVSDERRHLIERNVETVNFPDRIYALGGGGRKIVLEMFSEDWVPIEAMRNRDRDIDLVFIDSASENKENHANDISELRQQLDSLEELMQEQTAPATDIGSFNVRDEIITDHINISTRASLTGEQPVNRIMQHTDADRWWVQNEHLDAVNDSSNFYDVSQGAVKRRALGKALHYKALTQGGQTYSDALVSNVEESEIAIFAGLGGGTGSGILIDVAQKIREHNEAASIRAFTTLPSSFQRDQAQANAYAALSELEYMSLNHENTFNDIFLIPLEPTGLDSETTDSPELRELDRALAYALLGAYNATDRDYALSDTTSYAPFTIVVPQVLRYSRDEIKRKKDAVHELLDTKRALLNQEYDNLQYVSEYLNQHYRTVADLPDVSLSTDAKEYLRQRLARLDALLTSTLLEKLELTIAEEAEPIREDIYGENIDPSAVSIQDTVQRRGLEQIIQEIDIFVNMEGIDDGRVGDYAEFNDEFLSDVVQTELARLARLYRVLCRLEAAEQANLDSQRDEVHTDVDTKLLKTLLIPDCDRAIRKKRFRAVKTTLEAVDERRSECKQALSSARENRDAEEQRIEQFVNGVVNNGQRTLEPLLEDYQKVANLSVDRHVQAVDKALSEFASALATESDVETSVSDVQDALEGLRTAVAHDFRSDTATGRIDFAGLEQDITESVTKAKIARTRWDELTAQAGDSGLLDRLFQSESSQMLDPDRYRTPYEQLKTHDVFSIPRPPSTENALKRTDFTVEVSLDLESRVKQRVDAVKSDLADVIVDQFISVYKNSIADAGDSDPSYSGFESGTSISTGEVTTQLKDILRHLPDNLSERVTNLLRERARDELETELDEYEETIEHQQTRLETLSARAERLEGTLTIFDEVKDGVSDSTWALQTDYNEDYDREVLNLPYHRQKRHTIDSRYRQEVTPSDLTSVVRKQSISQTDLLESSSIHEISQERQNIQRSLTKLTDNKILDGKYCGLAQPRLSTDNIDTCRETGVYVAYAGEAVSGSGSSGTLGPDDFADVKQKLIKNFGIEEIANQYDQWFVSNGDPWEVSMCVYIQGISFLDNLRVFSATDGYRHRYRSLSDGQPTTKQSARHAYNLENGNYIRRSTLVDVSQQASFYLEQSSSAIQNKLIERHERIEIDQSATLTAQDD